MLSSPPCISPNERTASMVLVYLILGLAIFGLLYLMTEAVDRA
jgi:hypothetical protein